MTEPEVGHNFFRSRVTIQPDGDGYVVNGLTGITSGTDIVDRVLVFGRVPRADDEDGPARFTTVLLDPHADGATMTEQPLGGREGIRQYYLSLENVKMPREVLVGEEGQGLLALWPSTHIERVLTAAIAIGGMRYCIKRSRERATAHSVFGGQPIGAE